MGRARFRAWLAGRRSGKSYAAAVWLLGGKAGETSVFCARTLKSAKGIILSVFAELNAKYHLGLDIRASTGTIREPSGHVIQLYGLRDKGAADLMRGLSRLRLVFIDELGAFPDELLKYSIESVLQPMLLDLRGDMTIAGTPGPIPKGYAFEVTGNPGLQEPTRGRWPAHHWTYRDNPHVPGEEVLAEALAVNGATPLSATFQREYGAIWCEDGDALIYRYRGERWGTPPEAGITLMAIDTGVVDQTTWVVGRQPYESRPHVWILKALALDGGSLPEIAATTKQLRERFGVNRMFVGDDSLSKGYARQLREQYRLPVEEVTRAHKRARIDGIRGRLSAETLHLCAEAEPLADEWLTLCWNEDRTDHHERMPDDLSDAAGYLLDAHEFSAIAMPQSSVVVIDPMSELKRRASMKALRGAGLGNI